jgi:hypothetical protein
MSTLITNIAELMTQDLEHRVLKDAAVVIEGERISWIGPAAGAPAADDAVDAGGRALLPGWVDSHTHLIFAGDRTAEFEARMAGESYAAGGIAVTMNATRGTSDFDLTRLALSRVDEAVSQGSTYIETKTGYGLDVEHETRSARIASTVADQVTYLGAHLVPAGQDADQYTDLVCGPMLAAVRPYVQWADVFCEDGGLHGRAVPSRPAGLPRRRPGTPRPWKPARRRARRAACRGARGRQRRPRELPFCEGRCGAGRNLDGLGCRFRIRPAGHRRYLPSRLRPLNPPAPRARAGAP